MKRHDSQTIQSYDHQAAAYAKDWLSQPEPTEIHDLVRKFFHAGAPSADIGCGSGRDVDWLCRNGFPTIGFDASRGLILEAQKQFPEREFREACLPSLSEISDRSFDNVLCETVLMHLPHESIEAAVTSLHRILRPGGILQLSWRLPDGTETRKADGRLYTPIEFSDLLPTLRALGVKVLHEAEIRSASSGKIIRQLVLQASK